MFLILHLDSFLAKTTQIMQVNLISSKHTRSKYSLPSLNWLEEIIPLFINILKTSIRLPALEARLMNTGSAFKLLKMNGTRNLQTNIATFIVSHEVIKPEILDKNPFNKVRIRKKVYI